jgi:CHAD domain-containing protein
LIDQSEHPLVNILSKRWTDFYMQLNICRKDATLETVHDLRVVTRRLLTLLDLFRVLEPNSQLIQVRKLLRDLHASFDQLRDTQMVIASLSDVIDILPEVEPFISYLQKSEKRLLKKVSEFVSKLKPGYLIKKFSAVRQSIKVLFEETGTVYIQLLEPTDEVFTEVLHRVNLLDPTQITTIHELRIVFRKFRYLMEVEYLLLPDYPVEYLGLMHDFQDLMGDVQNLEVLLSQLLVFNKKQKNGRLDNVIEYFKMRHAAAVRAFFEHKIDISVFWRPSRSAQFPWLQMNRTGTFPETITEDNTQKNGVV